jgi:transcriptional regulator with XRE-family HTH domain
MRQIDIVQRSAALGDGLTKAEVNRLCRGGTDPKVSTLEKVARAMGVSVGDLFPPTSLQHRLDVAEVEDDLVVIDTWSRLPAAGDLVAIRHPAERTLRIMRVSMDGKRHRFTDEQGYVLGDADLIVGEVVLTFRRPRSSRLAATTVA